jgi:hypothetical protein
MCRQLLWLLPIFVFMVLAGLSPVASAHPEHAHEALAQSTNHEAGPAIDGPTGERPIIQAASTTSAPCNCPAGHCGCSVDCTTHCANGAAIFDLPDLRPMRGQQAFTPGRVTRIAEWTPRTDCDPPRRSA